ncbi:RNA-binding region-containing protein 3-like [Sitophilus oryzae]|uniref:RNA-binding region-containing protein 3-like n=1 Tax=Sitophilus oryzae TaxID=7048 RepID=A0A6J2YRF3_SITOR|nr:RNA-binding region-containing protein 3-like [Sitophilus oryzae]
MVCKNTLRIKHLPKELSDAQKEDFARHFGAIKAKVITSKAKSKSVVYAKFETEEIAKNVLLRLHQITVLNCILCVEYAENDILHGVLENKKADLQDLPDQKFFKTFINKINAFNDTVGFHQPPPSHLKYNYPKANRPTINNIAHALATVPRFYIQVLHLMNKMNLPPPFAMPNPPVRTIHPSQHPVIETKPSETVTNKAESSESELESDGESSKVKEVIPQKRTLPQKKVIKRPKFIKQPVVQATTNPSSVEGKNGDMFEKVDVQPQKKIDIKVSSGSLEDNKRSESNVDKQNVLEDVVKENKSVINPQELVLNVPENQPKTVETQKKIEEVNKEPTKPEKNVSIDHKLLENDNEQIQKTGDKSDNQNIEESNEKQSVEIKEQPVQNPEPERLQDPDSPEDDYPCISLEELAANQITDFSSVPVFKNYNSGPPTNKLYIKNCAKTVVLQDLEYIYNRYREELTENRPSEFNIRLMQEGRMRGQAFVTLDSVEMAQKAVNETNGFILKDKPLVVVFGKAGTKK